MFSLSTPKDGLDALATYVRKTRLALNISFDELSTSSGVSKSTLIRLEKSGATSTENIFRIFAALGCLDKFIEALSPPLPSSIAEARRLAGHERAKARRKP